MLRIILGAISGVIVWVIVVITCNFLVRKTWADYAAVEKVMNFTLSMMIARLSMSGLSSVVSGFVAALVARERLKAAFASGVLLLILFIPLHISLWPKFPVWYHLTFLISLPILSAVGGRFAAVQAKT
jgi:hypothetical protein